MTDERKGLSKASMQGLRTKERMERIRAAAPPGIRVVPASDAIRKLMKHPARGGFPAEGGAEWPDDRFTKRRLADGSVKREEPQADKHPEQQPTHPPPHQRAHRQREAQSTEPNDAA